MHRSSEGQAHARTGTGRSARGSTPAAWDSLPEHLDLAVVRGRLPDHLEGAERPWPWIEVVPDRVLVRFETLGILVEEGRRVTVCWDEEREPGTDPSWVLHSWAVQIAALQRGNLSLHAATVQVGDSCVAIAGKSGSGKSTTAMGLRRRGHLLLVDDVTQVEFRHGGVWTTPYARSVHLLPNSAEALGIDFSTLARLAGGRSKAAFPLEPPLVVPHRIDSVVALTPAPGPAGEHPPVRLERVEGAARFRTLIAHTVLDGVAPLVLGQERYFHLLASLASSVEVHVLHRDADSWSLDAVIDAIEQHALAASGGAAR